jgi:hypothetical protein
MWGNGVELKDATAGQHPKVFPPSSLLSFDQSMTISRSLCAALVAALLLTHTFAIQLRQLKTQTKLDLPYETQSYLVAVKSNADLTSHIHGLQASFGALGVFFQSFEDRCAQIFDFNGVKAYTADLSSDEAAALESMREVQ